LLSTHVGCMGHRWGSTSCGGHHRSLCWVPSRVCHKQLSSLPTSRVHVRAVECVVLCCAQPVLWTVHTRQDCMLADPQREGRVWWCLGKARDSTSQGMTSSSSGFGVGRTIQFSICCVCRMCMHSLDTLHVTLPPILRLWCQSFHPSPMYNATQQALAISTC
jgi:hypothetical protein